MRKLLKVERKNIFSSTYINDKHKWIDRTIRIIFIIVLLIGFIVNSGREPLEKNLVFGIILYSLSISLSNGNS
nr:DUF4181 domain-containing protein [Oceanobacillus piezotolerans]